MPLYDPATLTRLISQLRKGLDRLQMLRQVERDAFLYDPDKIGSAKYHFIVAIESCIDICNHLIARNGYRAPEDYADTFASLSEAGGIEEAFAEELKKMAKFRSGGNTKPLGYESKGRRTMIDCMDKKAFGFWFLWPAPAIYWFTAMTKSTMCLSTKY